MNPAATRETQYIGCDFAVSLATRRYLSSGVISADTLIRHRTASLVRICAHSINFCHSYGTRVGRAPAPFRSQLGSRPPTSGAARPDHGAGKLTPIEG